MTHNQLVEIVGKNIKDRNDVFEPLMNSIRDKLKRPIDNTTEYLDNILNYARKTKKPHPSISTDDSWKDVVHTEKGLRYKHHQYGPDASDYNISTSNQYLFFSRINKSSYYSSFKFDINHYNKEILDKGLELFNKYTAILYKLREEDSTDTVKFQKNGIAYTLEAKYGYSYGSDSTNCIKLTSGNKEYRITKKSLSCPSLTRDLVCGNCFFDIQEEIEKEKIIQNFLPTLDEYLAERAKELQDNEKNLKEFLTPYLVLKALK